MIHDLAVNLLGNTLVKTAVSGFHVEDRDLQPLGGERGKATVGVTQQQDSVGLYLGQYLGRFADDEADGFGCALARSLEKDIRTADLEVVKEDLVEFVIVVLSGMDQNVFGVTVQCGDDTREADDLWPCT